MVLYVDPPLKAQPLKSVNGCMTWNKFADKFSEKVYGLEEKNVAVFMWTTATNMQKTLALFKRCKFTFRTIAFVWVKRDTRGQPVVGPGSWTRISTEYVLLATKGSCKRKTKNVAQILEYPVTKSKPTAAVARIKQLIGEDNIVTVGIDIQGCQNIFIGG